MNKFKIIGITLFTALALSGCQNTSDREAMLEEQVAQLEQQITSLEKENSDVSVSSENNPSENHSASDDTFDDLTSAVDAVVNKANNASPSGTNEAKQTQFFELKNELQGIEQRLDRYEDKIERQFRNGELSFENARQEEILIEKLEEKLDDAEDWLENIFGYDD